MKQFFVTIAGVFVGLFLFFVVAFVVLPVVLIGVLSAAQGNVEPPLREEMVLELDLRPGMLDQPAQNPFAFAQAPALLDVVRALEAAERDERVKGVFIRANETGIPAAQAEEIRDALLGLRQAGKFVVAHSQGFDSTSVLPYLAISAADEIWLQQTATFAAAGLSTETTFLGGAIEKYDAQSQILQIAEYKTAANSYNQSGYTEEHRESLTSLLSSVYGEAVREIAADRGLTPEEVEALFETAPYSAEGAARAGLIDRVGHLDEAQESALTRAENADFTPLGEYLHAMDQPWDEGPVIALVQGQGEIVTGESWGEDSLFSGGDIIGSDTLARAFNDAAEDDDVRAILFRIDSPGGSVVASEQIWHAAEMAKAAGKPIVVSMGPLAASGGYYVAAPADAIVAQPGTLTGSIGIYGGKIVLDGTLDLVGLNIEPLSVGGEFSGAYTSQRPFTDSQLAAMQAQLRDGYDTFTGHVAAGRNLTSAQVEQIARGRVWTGAQAVEIGLVDELGGFRTALAAAKREAGIDADENVTLRSYPARPTFFEQVQRLFGNSGEMAETASVLMQIAAMPEVRAMIAARSASGQPASARADIPAVR